MHRETMASMKLSKSALFLSTALIVATGATATVATSPKLAFVRGDVDASATSTSTKPNVLHIATPVPVRAIYMTQCVVGTPSMREDLLKLIDDTELNAVVIDIKDYTGKLAFTPEDPALKDSVSDQCGAKDMEEFIRKAYM